MSDAVNDLLINDAVKHDDGIKRDQYGRYMLADPTTGEIKPWTRATTLANILDDASGLELWRNRNIVYGIGRRPDLYALASSVSGATSAEDKATLDGVIATAEDVGGGNDKSNLGTAMHGFTQRLDIGENGVEVPAAWAHDIAAYVQGMKTYGLWTHERYVERVVLVPELDVAGTIDRLLMGDGWEDPRVGDLKTGKVEGKGRSFAVQLAIYAHATHWYNPQTNTYHDMPKIDQNTAVVIHLPIGEGRCDFYEVDIAAGWQAALLAADVHAWRKRKDLCAPLSKWEPKPEATTLHVVDVEPTDAERARFYADKGILEPSPSEPEAIVPVEGKTQAKAEAEVAEIKTTLARKSPDLLDGVGTAESEAADIQAEQKTIVEATPQTEAAIVEAERNPASMLDGTDPLIEVGPDPRDEVEGLFDRRFEWIKSRVQYVAVTHKQAQELAEVWSQRCPAVATFRKGGPTTHQEIDAVASACALVEMTALLPFFDPVDPAKNGKANNILKGVTGEQLSISE